MVERVFILAGRSLQGILADVRAAWPGAEVIVVGDPLDTLTPDDARTGSDRFKGLSGRAVLVANGGRTTLQVAAILAAAEGGAVIVDCQRDGLTVCKGPNNLDFEWFTFWQQ